jgi:hypothetical protein
VSRFFETAREIMETAESATSAGLAVSDVTIVVGQGGSLHFISDCDWPLASLARENSAEMVYRVKSDTDGVRVEGRAGSHFCQFSMPAPQAAASQLLGGTVWYPAMPLSESARLLPAAWD